MTHQDELLLLVEERSDYGRLYFLPKSYEGYWCNRLGRDVTVGGAGTAMALRALERKGFIEFEPKLSKYACRITENGKLHAQTLS